MKDETKAFVLNTLKLKSNALTEQLQRLSAELEMTRRAIGDIELPQPKTT